MRSIGWESTDLNQPASVKERTRHNLKPSPPTAQERSSVPPIFSLAPHPAKTTPTDRPPETPPFALSAEATPSKTYCSSTRTHHNRLQPPTRQHSFHQPAS